MAIRNLGWFIELMPALEVKRDRMREMAGEHWAQATDVAGALVREKGLPWRTAHQIVGILVRITEARGIRPREVTPELVNEASVEYMGEEVGLSKETLARALDPMVFVERRTLYGGPAPEECRRRMAEYEERLKVDEGSVAEREGKLGEAARKLEVAIDGILG